MQTLDNKNTIPNALEFPKGLNEEVIRKISSLKNEPDWMLQLRLDAYKYFVDKSLPNWGPDLNDLDFQDIKYYASGGEKAKTWNDIPGDIKNTFEQLGLSENEQNMLAGISTQYESEVIYHQLKEKWNSQGIIFEDTDSGLKKYPDMFKKYFGHLISYTDNKFSALNTAVWSGGTYIYVPKGVKLLMPVQTYFRINTETMGQFERTLIIADEGSEIHYIEGCTAPQYMSNSLHAAVVEIFIMKDAKVRYTTIQNWSKNIYNLVTKRAVTEENGIMEWVDCNLGSKITMKYPSVILKGDHSKGVLLSMAMAQQDQNIDSGGKMIHIGKNTTSVINSRSVSKENGIAAYRGLVKILPGADNSKSNVSCNGLVMNEDSVSYAIPTNSVANDSSIIEHEASVSSVSEDALNYFKSRGFSVDDAIQLIVSGFISPIADELPFEYSVELERLTEMFLKKNK